MEILPERFSTTTLLFPKKTIVIVAESSLRGDEIAWGVEIFILMPKTKKFLNHSRPYIFKSAFTIISVMKNYYFSLTYPEEGNTGLRPSETSHSGK